MTSSIRWLGLAGLAQRARALRREERAARVEQHALGSAGRPNRLETAVANPVVNSPPAHTKEQGRLVQREAAPQAGRVGGR